MEHKIKVLGVGTPGAGSKTFKSYRKMSSSTGSGGAPVLGRVGPSSFGMDLKTLQDEVNSRWSKQLGNPCHRSADPNHTLIHMTKALGKLASALNEAEHEERSLIAPEIDKYLADLVICAARFANGIVNLDQACWARLAEKFPAQREDGDLVDENK